jgi:hypothetical protein
MQDRLAEMFKFQEGEDFEAVDHRSAVLAWIEDRRSLASA